MINITIIIIIIIIIVIIISIIIFITVKCRSWAGSTPHPPPPPPSHQEISEYSPTIRRHSTKQCGFQAKKIDFAKQGLFRKGGGIF